MTAPLWVYFQIHAYALEYLLTALACLGYVLTLDASSYLSAETREAILCEGGLLASCQALCFRGIPSYCRAPLDRGLSSNTDLAPNSTAPVRASTRAILALLLSGGGSDR